MSSRALRWNREALVLAFAGLCVGAAFVMRATPARAWSTYAGNSQHTAVSATAAQPFGTLHWVTPVDLAPPTGEIYIHYGSPLVTPANTVVIPIKTGSAGGYRVDARSGADGSLLWSQSTDYILPPHNWTPSYSPALTSTNRLYFAGAGGTVYFRDDVDSGGPASTGQLAFYGMANYVANPASYNSTVFVNTPITADSAGNIYFGFRVSGTAPLGLQSGIARIDSNGNGTWSAAVDASGGDPNITRVPHQAAPALSNDEQTLYVSIASNSTNSYLVGLDPTTLVLKESSPGVKVRVALKDPRNGGVNNAQVSDDSSASPMVGPDGDVYYGVLGNPFNGSRGWMLHFSADLTQTKAPGAFGWDSTPSVVAAAAVPSYAGTSSYLIFTKYNNYAGYDGGDGVNKIAVLDPNDTMTEPHASSNGQLVMKVVLSIAGPTPDPDYVAQFPNAVREWCINSGAVDPLTGSVIANSEDGNVYRWDLSTNTLSEAITLSPGVGEAYTPTVIGPDGTVYAINWAILNAVGSLPTATPTNTPTETPTETVTNTPTSTPTPTPTGTIAPTDTPTDTPTVTPTAAPTDTPTNTPTPTATVSLHDSVVLPRPPLTVHLRRAAPVVKTIRITVVNADILPIAETPGHTITLIASDGDCPLGTVSGSPHFISRAGDLGDSILLAGGKSATAKVTLNISASAFTSFNHRTPTRCTLQFSVTSSGNSDPVPGNNTIPVELNVIDHTDPEQTAVHENFVNSLLPLTLTILDGKPSATKTRRPVVSNADILPIAENPGDSLTVTGSDGTCPAGTLGLLDMDRTMAGAQNAVTVKGGRATTGTLPVTASSTLVTTTNEKSPTRCIATVTVAGPGGDTDGTNNTTKLVIDVYDKNDF